MSQPFAEALLFSSLAPNAGLLLFIAGVLRKVMDDMSEAEFQSFLSKLVRHSRRSPYMITALNIPLLGSVPYFFFFGFGNHWLVSGLSLWVAGPFSKVYQASDL
jgi:hypothetical protein